MKYLVVALLASVAVAPSGAFAQQNDRPARGGHVFAISAQNGSGESGTFALKPRGDRTTIEIHLLHAPSSLQPAHLHAGSCAKLNPVPKYALKSLKDGISESSVDESMTSLLAQGLALNVHESAANLKRYVACGNL